MFISSKGDGKKKKKKISLKIKNINVFKNNIKNN